MSKKSQEEIQLRKKITAEIKEAIEKKADLSKFYPPNYNELKGKIKEGTLSKQEAKTLYDHFENIGPTGTEKRLLCESFLKDINKEINGDKNLLHKLTAVLIEVDRESDKVRSDPAQFIRNVNLARNCLEFECVANNFGKELVPIAKANNIDSNKFNSDIREFKSKLYKALPKNKRQETPAKEDIKETRTNRQQLKSFREQLNKAEISREKLDDLTLKLNDLEKIEKMNYVAQKNLNNAVNKLEMPKFLQDHYKNTIEPHFVEASKNNKKAVTPQKQQELAKKNAVFTIIFNAISLAVPKYLEQEGLNFNSIQTISFRSNIKATELGKQTKEASEIFHNKLSGNSKVTGINVEKEKTETITPIIKSQERNQDKARKILGVGASPNMIGKGSATKVDKVLGKDEPPAPPKKNIFGRAFDKIKQVTNTLKDRFTKPAVSPETKIPNNPPSRVNTQNIEKPQGFKSVGEINNKLDKAPPTKDIAVKTPTINTKPNPELKQEEQELTQGSKEKMKEKFRNPQNQKPTISQTTAPEKEAKQTPPPIPPKPNISNDINKIRQRLTTQSSTIIKKPETPKALANPPRPMTTHNKNSGMGGRE